jgi:hypothetical protein
MAARLTALAHTRIASGELPCVVLPTVWAETSSNKTCSLCRCAIPLRETSYEVNVEAQEGIASQVLHFHIMCHMAWTIVCLERPAAAPG